MTDRRNMARYLILAVLVPVSLIWFNGSNLGTKAGSPSLESQDVLQPMPVVVESAKQVSQIERLRAYTGSVVASRTSQLSFERGGRVVSVYVNEGDVVRKDQLLGEIDVAQVASRLSSAQAAVRQAEAVLEELVAGPRAEVIASSRATVASLDADVTRLQKDFERSERLVASKSISSERFDAVRFQRDATLARRDAAQKQLDELVAGTRSEKLTAQQATLEQLKAEQRTLELDLEDGRLLAPFAGTISQRLVDEGTVVTPGLATLEIVEDAAFEAWVGVPPAVGATLEIGKNYVGHVLEQRVEMRLRSLRPRLDDMTRTQNAVFEMEENSTLVPGQIVRLEVPQVVKTVGFVLPTSALVAGPRGLWNVFVAKQVDNGWIVEQRNVTLTESMGTHSLVTGTLESGMQVIVDGVHRVVGGQQVEPQVREATDWRTAAQKESP